MTSNLLEPVVPNKSELLAEKARRAVSAFRAMQPGLTGYARAITGNQKVRVEASKDSARTDGTVIYFRPPIELGDNTPHKRSLCDRRDFATGLQICDACRVREEILVSIYHEIAHIAFGTFEKPTIHAKKEALERAIEESGTKYAAKIRAAWEKTPDWKKNDYINLSSLISPFLPTLVNALEDARVDTTMFRARKGTKVMFDASVRNIFNAGFEGSEGETILWSERPLNSQAVIGVYVLACRYDYQGWFSPEAEEALGDKELNELVSRVDTMRSAEATYTLAFPVLARLRELGFCKLPEEEEDEDEQEEPQESPESSTGQDRDDPSPEDEQDDSESGSIDMADQEDVSDGGSGSEDGSDDSGISGDGSQEDESDSNEASSQGDPSDGSVSGDEPSNEESDDSGEGEYESSSGAGSSDEGDSGPDGDQEVSGRPGDSDGEASDDSRGDGLEDEAGSGNRKDSESGDGSDRSSESHGDDEEDPFDTGADQGLGGIRTESQDYGSVDEAVEDLKAFSGHGKEVQPATPSEVEEEQAVTVAVIQGLYFEKSSTFVHGVREHKYGQTLEENGRNTTTAWESVNSQPLLEIPESILGPALMEMRRTFADNKRASFEAHLKSGKINQRVLGKRAWAGDDRLFRKKRIPGKKSYAVLLGIDISGSTWGVNLELAKRAAVAQAELCSRAGIDFAVYAHTANPEAGTAYWNNLSLDIYEIKSFDAPWDTKSKQALSDIQADAENLDGHTIEFYRKMIERNPATDKIILYYSDGKMPAANHDEELEVLEREIAYCKRKKITLLGVGIRTDSPRRHGLDTVQVDNDSDVSKVVKHLESALLVGR